MYQANTKFPSLHDKTDITDASGAQVAHIERKFFSLHERHFITMADGTSFQLSNEFFHIIKDITNIEGLGWQLRGNILGLNLPEAEPVVVAILVTLQHMIKDREARASSSSSSSSSGN